MNTFLTYQNWIKPSFAPPSWIFGPIWTVLYILIFISFGYVVRLFLEHKISWVILLPFVLNILFNILYTPLQFRLGNLLLASIDILLVLGTLVWAMIVIHPFASWVSYINIPYLLWVSFATVLQLSIYFLN